MTFSGEFFFPSQVPEFFIKGKKGTKIPLVPNTMMQRTPNESALISLCCSLCMLLYFVLVFSEAKCKPVEIIQGDVLLLN